MADVRRLDGVASSSLSSSELEEATSTRGFLDDILTQARLSDWLRLFVRKICFQKNRVLKKSKNEVGFEPGACRDFFRAGPFPRAGRRPVGPVKIGGFPGPERLLIRRRNQAQYRFRKALGVSALKNRNNSFL